jgi:copper transport protein
VLIALPAFLAALLSLITSRLAARALALVALLGIGLALAASGHASAAAPEWLTRPAVFTHGVAVALWLGALVPLGLLLWRSPTDAAVPLNRFSRGIPFVVAALVTSGLVLAVIQLETLSALWTTDYGLVLVRKLILLLPVFALAALNRWWFTAKAGDVHSARALTRAIAIETILVVVVLAIVASWRFTPPPRALTLASSTTVAHIHTEKAMAEITIRPDAAGPVAISIMLLNGEFAELNPKEVTLSLSLPSAGIEPITRAAKFAGDNTWTIEGIVVPAPGIWSARVDILISDFETVALEQPIPIGIKP